MLKTKDDTPGLERRSVTSAMWSAVGGYGNVFLSFAVFLILARLLTPDEFGLVAIATVFVDIILVIARGGLPEAVVQRPQLEEDYADTAFWFSLGWGAALCVALSVAAPFLAGLFGLAELGPVLMALSAVLLIMGAGSIHEARLQRAFAFRKLAMRAIFQHARRGHCHSSCPPGMGHMGHGGPAPAGQYRNDDHELARIRLGAAPPFRQALRG